jgi:eukaryotic-like serine/threonine-protein kinase
LEGHGAEPTEVAFNHRGDLLASTGWDSTIRLWDPLGGRQLVSTSGAAYFALPFRPDDRRLGFAVRGLKVGLWDVADGRECRTLFVRQVGSGYWKGPRDAEFSPDGHLIASASTDGVRVWDVAAGREIAFLPIEDARSAIFDPAGGSLITCGQDGLHRWPITPDPEMGSRGVRIGPPQDLGVAKELGWARLSRDGRMLLVGHRDDAPAYVVDMREPTKSVLLRDRIMPWPEISPDGRWAAGHAGGTSPFEGSFRAWDLRSGKRVWDWPVNSGTVAFSPDSKWLVTGSGAETRFWKVGSWQPGRRILWEPGTNHGSMVFSRDGKMLAIVHLPRLVKLIDPSTGRELATLDTPNLQNVGWLRFSPDGSQLAITDWNHTIHLWDLRLVRRQLAAMGLDWDLSPYPPAPARLAPKPLSAAVLPLAEGANASH